MLLLFRVDAKHTSMKTDEEIVCVRYVECTEPVDRIDKSLEFVCLRCRKLHVVHRSEMKEREARVPEHGDRRSTEQFSSIGRGDSLILENNATIKFIYPRRQAQHRSYVNRIATGFRKVL